jgi:hypothetical protein
MQREYQKDVESAPVSSLPSETDTAKDTGETLSDGNEDGHEEEDVQNAENDPVNVSGVGKAIHKVCSLYLSVPLHTLITLDRFALSSKLLV